MTKTKIIELNEFGQSAWLDYISRSLIESGKLKRMIDIGLRGMTSNPTIFDKAISSSKDYDEKISELCRTGKSTFDIYDDLTIKDIQDATDIFAPVYEKTQGLDGYVSLEINPKLAFNAKETIKEGKRLYKKVNRPNLMLKVPSTKDGFDAIEELIATGINVNATLIFSIEQYKNTAQAYIRGIGHLLKNKGDVHKVHSVASVFVSRIDTVVDKLLDQLMKSEKDQRNKELLANLRGKAAVANSRLIYKEFLNIFYSANFLEIKNKGVNPQRVLWGSTSTKNPAYSDIKYVSELIAKDTVNTIPEPTFQAFLDHGIVKEAATSEVKNEESTIKTLKALDINIDDICSKLLQDGVIAFEKSFDSLLNSIEEKSKQMCNL